MTRETVASVRAVCDLSPIAPAVQQITDAWRSQPALPAARFRPDAARVILIRPPLDHPAASQRVAEWHRAVSCPSMANVLSPTMTVREFENGYWYLDHLQSFAERIGIPAAKKLRKDELEEAIVAFLRGDAVLPSTRSLRKTGVKDLERGLSLKLRIGNYTSNRETKDFIVDQARRMAPDVREKSGVWYRLNRWREERIASGKRPTYGDLVRQYVVLNRMPRFARAPPLLRQLRR
jgi:hypothetical protein